MASSRVKFKLPTLSVTQRSTAGEVTHRTIPRGCTVPQCDSSNQSPDSDGVADGDPLNDSGNGGAYFSLSDASGVGKEEQSAASLPSLHEIAQKSSTESWRKIRPTLLRAAIESNAMPPNQDCVFCYADKALYRCLQCGPKAFFCLHCFGGAHSGNINLFHTGEVWEDGVYRPLVTKRTVDVRNHACGSVNFVPLCCVTEYGEEHNIEFASCDCEPLVATMARAHIWPSTAQRPHLAFTYELLDWMEALLLECQVSVNDFCKALYFRCRHLVVKRKDIYSTLINAFEEYRWLKVELRQMTHACPELDKGNVCPACPKASGAVVLSLDALFGLPRKKAAGKSYRDPLHGDLFFGSQSSVDEYVSSYDSSGPIHFLAGDSLRSSRRYHALDETAAFGSACRHEFPWLFINLKHGERFSYVVWLLEELAQRVSVETDIYIMYDVACNLVRHLRANKNGAHAHLLERMKFSLPSFHAFGHVTSCQVVYGPTRCEGIGLSDGEVMERMWSYLRRFSRMTKAHRVDILSHALLYYGTKTKQKLPSLLANRWLKAIEMNSLSKQTLESLCKSVKGIQPRSSTLESNSDYAVPVTVAIIESWVKDDQEAMTCDIRERTLTLEWKESYYHALQSYYMARDQLNNSSGSRDISTMREKFFSLDSKVADMERRFGVVARWARTDKDYLDAKRFSITEKKNRIHSSLWASVVKRHYLLRMKAKYADGQKIAKKLCVNIGRETKRVKGLLADFNYCVCELQSGHDSPVLLSEVLSLNSEFWVKQASSRVGSEQIPWKVKQEVVQAYLMMKRSGEEMQLLKADMTSTLQYWLLRRLIITSKLNELDSVQEDLYLRGVKCLLEQLRWEAELHHHRATVLFSECIELPPDILSLNSNITRTEVSDETDDDSDEENSDVSEEDY